MRWPKRAQQQKQHKHTSIYGNNRAETTKHRETKTERTMETHFGTPGNGNALGRADSVTLIALEGAGEQRKSGYGEAEG